MTKPPNATIPSAATKLSVRKLNVWFGKKQALKDVSFDVPEKTVTAIMGPSGCGKSTLIRSFNRMHDLTAGARVEGQVLHDGRDLLARDANPVELRRRVGMVFQRPNPFPMMSIVENVTFALRMMGEGRKEREAKAESSLKRAALWDEVKDRLDSPSASLSGGQQQRLCIARALAVEPDTLLMDEPCSALDPIATAKIEDLILELKRDYTVVIVTHNMQQAARVSDQTAFFYLGELVEYGPTKRVFENPQDKRTEDYVTGRFG